MLKEARELTPTKRTVVSVATRFYDPLGILSPVTIQFKILFQQTCKEGLDWDDPLTGDLLDQWNHIITDEVTKPLVIPRYYIRGIGIGDKSFSLIGFSDASMKAYAAIIYICLETSEEQHIRFIVSKTRVSPISGQTIP